ncbi:MAG TPA: acyl-CoA dehydrogenase family protein [Symbiobacteriaceae bacterium]|nr:acyl-CoA dehydrogenase family protein [Symbiobacteriaceae bacterium]
MLDTNLTPALRQIQTKAKELAASFAERAAQHDADRSAPMANYALLREAGFYGITVPKEYGGMGAGLLGWAVAAEELAQGCPSTALSFNMHVMNMGITFEDQEVPESAKRRVAELVIGEGKLTCGIGSEPGSSSHLGGSFQMQTVAKRVEGGYRVSGTKRFATMWEASDLAFMWVKPEGAANPMTATALLVPTKGEGITVADLWDPIGMRATRSNTVTLDGVFVPDANVLYTVDHWAQSFLGANGPWSYGAYTNVYLGVGVAILNKMKQLSSERVAKGYAQPMSYHPDVRRRVAEVAAELDAARLVGRNATEMHMAMGPSLATMEAFMKAKYLTGKAVSKAVQYATVACGISALSRSVGLERLMRDAATAPIQPPSEDMALDFIGQIELGLNPAEIVSPVKMA